LRTLPGESASGAAVPLPQRVGDRAVDDGESVRPGVGDVCRAQSDHDSAESDNVQVSIAIQHVTVLRTVPGAAVDLESDAVLDDEIFVTHAGYGALCLNVIADSLQPEAHDRLVAGPAARDQATDAILQPARSEPAQPPHPLEREVSLVHGGLHGGDGILLVEAVHRLPQRLRGSGPPG
jgi:hypothetical protein